MFFKEFFQPVGNDVVDDALDFAVAQLGLGLAFELRFPYFDADDRRQAFADVFAGQVVFVLFDDAGTAAIIVDRTRQAGTEAAQMRTPFFSEDIVDEGQDIFTVAVVILHGNVDDDLVLFAVDVDDRRIDGLMAFVEEFDERRQAAFITVDFALAFAALIGQGDVQAFIEESQFAQARLQGIEVIDRVREDFMVRFERNFRPRFFSCFQRAYLPERLIGHAAGKGDVP